MSYWHSMPRPPCHLGSLFFSHGAWAVWWVRAWQREVRQKEGWQQKQKQRGRGQYNSFLALQYYMHLIYMPDSAVTSATTFTEQLASTANCSGCQQAASTLEWSAFRMNWDLSDSFKMLLGLFAACCLQTSSQVWLAFLENILLVNHFFNAGCGRLWLMERWLDFVR